MNYMQALFLAFVEGITEFLPISSTGHLILFSELLRINQSEFVKSFEIIIQLGAILAVVVIYFKKLVSNFNIELYKNLLIAFLPSAFFGLFLYKLIKQYLIGNSMVVVWSLLLGGIVIILFEKYFKNKESKTLTLKGYFIIGFFQVLSMIPGVSRSLATIFGAMISGLSRKDAAEFSFLLAIPTMAAATGLDLIKTDLSIWTNDNFITLAIGFIVSFITAYIVIKWLIKYVQTHNFAVFGWYRIVLALFYMLLINNKIN